VNPGFLKVSKKFQCDETVWKPGSLYAGLITLDGGHSMLDSGRPLIHAVPAAREVRAQLGERLT
jgi:hypothetical protein